jgi:glutamine amidotransferase PdxT
MHKLIGGQILTKAELLALRGLFSEHVISKLIKERFSISDIIEKDVATTLQQVQYILKNVGESTTCDQLKEELYSSMVTNFTCIL